ncbi:MAG: peptidase C13 [Gammaproteobacteria bacterium]|nr:MAG: peptidase C13 [Gammaproteobacteria bacterium]
MDSPASFVKFRLLRAFACAGLIVACLVTLVHAKSIIAITQATATEKSATKKSEAKPDEADTKPIAWPENVGSPEQVLYAQPQRMRDVLDKLAPRTPGKPNLYLISFAGDAEEDVFRNEVEYVEKLFTQRFDAKGHVVTLVNNTATLDRHPIASLSNFEIAIDALGKKMNPAEDVLMVFITTHGSREHELYVSLDPLPLDQIVPADLADVFSDSPIRHRVFVISACYSGGYIDALKNANTMVITASRADRSSFGCGTKSDITDFGRAFFVEGLNHTASFSEAFAEASHDVDAWEARDSQAHSLPQIATTPAIEAVLKAWRESIKLGPVVPFNVPVPKRHAPGQSTAQ